MSRLRKTPFECHGHLRFGTSRDAVRSLLGRTYGSFRKGGRGAPLMDALVDAYDELGL